MSTTIDKWKPAAKNSSAKLQTVLATKANQNVM